MIQRNPTFKFDLTYPSMQPQVYQRLGEKQATDIVVQVMNDGKPFSLTGVRFGFELRNDKAKIIIDTNQTHFSVIDNAKGIFRYRVTDEGFGYIGNSYLAYFTLTISDVRITTERFRFHNDEDVQVGADGLQEHYVSVIDDLVKSNAEALAKAQEIKAMIEDNQVVKKSGDTMTGNLKFNVSGGNKEITATDGTNDLYKWIMRGTNFEFFSQSLNKGIFNFNNTTGMFNVTADTNLVKKTEAFYDYAQPNGNAIQLPGVGTDLNTIQKTGIYAGTNLTNSPTSTSDFYYIEVVRYNDVNYIKQTATTITGPKPVIYTRKMTGKNVWNSWVKQANEEDVITKAKDGRADLVMTVNATPTAGSLSFVNRRGNTVTVALDLTRNVGTSSHVVTNIPSTMRPPEDIITDIISVDGTPGRLLFKANGEVQLNVTGKQFRTFQTFVVN